MPDVTARHRDPGSAFVPAGLPTRLGVFFGVLLVLGAAFPHPLVAQATGNLRRLPAPVRQAGHVENLPPAPLVIPSRVAPPMTDGTGAPGLSTPSVGANPTFRTPLPAAPPVHDTEGWAPNPDRLDWSHRIATPESRVTILRSPTMAPPAHSRGHATHSHGHHPGVSTGSTHPQSAAASGHPRISHHANRSVDPPRHPMVDGYHGIQQKMMKPHPNIPGAREPARTWKQPYSYGYFGASGKRHWGVHHGYRDRATEWRYR